jgi:hypothetical protein|tara:strand:- start:85 stop:696 length:612 start_codon:yes stop_codon:yes gene_type:complete
MELKMKKILILLFITISVNSYALKNGDSYGYSNNALLVQRALDSGITFESNQDEYQLILGGRAQIRNASNAPSNSSSLSDGNLWAAQKGNYQLSIGQATTSSSLSSTLSNDNVNYNLIAYNSRTGGIGIINGEIIVKLRPYYNALTIASTFNIDLISNFESISTAMYQVRKGQNIFSITNTLKGHPGVEFAELDITENPSIAK